MKYDRTIAINAWVTARQTTKDTYMLFSPSDETVAGHYIPANEINLRTEDIEKLAAWIKPPTVGEAEFDQHMGQQ